MTLICLFSAKGAPGTTTTAMLAGSLWPRPALLADCDPAGGDMGVRLPRPDGHPLDLGRGMLGLLPVARRALEPGALLEHAQPVLGGGELLVGLSGPEQAVAVGPLWNTIARAFVELPDRDVIVDVGRLDARSPVLPIATAAELVVCVVENSLTSIFAARARLRTLLPALAAGDGRGPRIGLVVRAQDTRDAAAAGGVIQGEFPDVAYLGHVAADATGAGMFDGRPVSRPERTLFVRSGAGVVAAMNEQLAPPAAVGAGSPAPAPRRSRLEERRFGQVDQRSRFFRGKRDAGKK